MITWAMIYLLCNGRTCVWLCDDKKAGALGGGGRLNVDCSQTKI